MFRGAALLGGWSDDDDDEEMAVGKFAERLFDQLEKHPARKKHKAMNQSDCNSVMTSGRYKMANVTENPKAVRSVTYIPRPLKQTFSIN